MTPAGLTEWRGASVAALRDRWGVPLLEIHASVTSTNDRALELAGRGAPPYSVVIAEEQTAGRGRRGATWVSPHGCGLLMSIVLPEEAGTTTAGLPLLAGLGVAEAIEAVTGDVAVRIKWPNDLWVGARKLGGVLCERAGAGIVAGVGVNVREPSGGRADVASETVTTLEVESLKTLSHKELCGEIIRGIERRIATSSGRLTEDAGRALRGRDALLGRPIRTESHGGGTAAGIADDGALLLRRDDGATVRVVAGSVRLR